MAQGVPTDLSRGLSRSGKKSFTPAPTAQAQTKFTFDQYLTDYAVLAFGGQDQWDITQLVTAITWTESFGSPAMEMNLTLATPKIRATTLESDASGFIGSNSAFESAARRGPAVNLNNIIKLGMGIRVFASRPDPTGVFIPLQRLAGGSYALAGEIFRGYVFTKSRSGSTNQDQMEIVCYDQMIYLAKNDYDTIFKNQTATEMIRTLCGLAGLKMANVGPDFANTHAKISRMVSYGNNLYDCCSLAIQKNKALTNKYYRLRSEGGRVVLRQRTTPSQTWYLTDSTNIIESSQSESIEDLVTGVQPKTSGKLGRSSYGPEVVNDGLERLYGRMRKVQDLSNLKASEVPKAIKTYMAENGKPKIECSITIPCVNTIRAGDLVKVRESDTGIVGLWYVSQISHTISATSATSQLSLVKTAQEAQVQLVTESTVDGTKSSTRKVTYDKIKGSDGKYVRYRVSAGIYTPTGKFQGQALIGDENVVKLSRHAASSLGGVGAFIQLQYGRFSVRCVVQVRGDYPYDVMVSTAAAAHLGIQNGNKIFIFPLKQHSTGSGTGAAGAGGGPTSGKYDSMILAAATKYNVHAALIKGVMEQESSFNPNSKSGPGATGLMQLMPGTAASMGYRDSEGPLTSPSISIKYGAIYLRQQLDAFHSIKLALAAYNAGPGAVRKYGNQVPPYAETQNYVRIVMANYQKYLQQGFGG